MDALVSHSAWNAGRGLTYPQLLSRPHIWQVQNHYIHLSTLIEAERESDLFWDELGSEDVDINWSFLALMFGVLMVIILSVKDRCRADR